MKMPRCRRESFISFSSALTTHKQTATKTPHFEHSRYFLKQSSVIKLQFTAAFITAAVAVSVFAAPVIQARGEIWIIESTHSEDTDAFCTWTFSINNQTDPTVPCTHNIDSDGSGSPFSSNVALSRPARSTRSSLDGTALVSVSPPGV